MTVSESPIHFDLPCLNCGYDLRGLNVDGRCPECGVNVGGSLASWRDAQRSSPDLSHANPQWVASIMEGLVFALLVFLLMLAFAIAASWSIKSRQMRVLMLGVVCAIWVFSWFSVWKLTSPPAMEARWNRGQRVWLRWSSTVCLAGMLAIDFAPRAIAFVVAIGWIAAGMTSTCLWFVYVAALARRCHRLRSSTVKVTIVLSVILAFWGPLAFFIALMPEFGRPRDPLWALTELPTSQYGAPEHIWVLVRRLPHASWEFTHLLILVHPLSGLAVTIGLFSSIWRTQRTFRPGIIAPATSRKTAASSGP